MEPFEKLRAESLAIRAANKEKDRTCKNGVFKINQTASDYKTMTFLYETENTGCKNPKRSGSAWCQECSDKHHKTLTDSKK